MQGKKEPNLNPGMQVRYVRILLAFSAIIVLVFGAYHTLLGEGLLAVVEAVMGFVFILGIIMLREPDNIRYVMHIMMGTGLVGALFNMRIETNTVMWMGALIIGAFTLFARKEGIAWAIVINVSVFVFMAVDSMRELPIYSLYFAVNVVLSCLWVSLIAFLLIEIRESNMSGRWKKKQNANEN